jgi:hypothetical protein
MKKYYLLLLVGVLPLFGFGQTDLVRWSSSDYVPVISNGNIEAANTTMGAVGVSMQINSYGTDTFFQSGNWPRPQDALGSNNANKYILFKIAPKAGYQINLTQFNFEARAQGGNSEKLKVEYSKVENFSSGVGSLRAETILGNSYNSYVNNFPANTKVLSNEILYVRIYVYNSDNNFHIKYIGGTNSGPVVMGSVVSNTLLAVADFQNVVKNTSTVINVLSNDFAGTTGTITGITSVSQPSAGLGSVIINNGNSIQFIPTHNLIGTTNFIYAITGSDGSTSSATVTVKIVNPSLAEWNLTSSNANTYGHPSLVANALSNNESTPSFNSMGMSLANFNGGNFQHNRFFEIRIKPLAGQLVDVSKLVFEQQRFISGSLTGPTHYAIRYNVVTSEPSSTSSFFSTSTVLIANESISANPLKEIDLIANLNDTQTLIVRFYAKGGNDFNYLGWRINANTLKLRGNVVCAPQGNPSIYTDDFWTGYAYTYTGTPAATTYIGYVEENETFDRNNASGAISGRGANFGRNNLCATPADNFLIRYRMKKTFPAGAYMFTVGGDDGYRLSLDGGATWLLGDYTNHSYNTQSAVVCFDGNTATEILIEYFESSGGSRISFNYVINEVASEPTQIIANNTSCSGQSVTLTASGGTGLIYQWGTGTVGDNIINNASSAAITVNFNGTTTYWVRRIVINCGGTPTTTAAVTKTVTLVTPVGDSSQFGINTWNVYAFSGQSMTPSVANYLGYYTQNTVSADTQDIANNGWNSNASPSSSAGWNGCNVAVDNFTFVHKRRGFAGGSYQLVVRNYDDATQILINGIQVRNYTNWFGGNSSFADNLGIFCLDGNTTIEVITNEGSGGATFRMDITPFNAIYTNNGWNENVDPTGKSIELQNNLTISNDLTVCSCTVKSGTTITIPAGRTFTVIGDVTVEQTGKIIVENNGSFVQINNNATFTGAIQSFEMRRNTQPVFRFDFTYWSSPVKESAGFTLNNLSPQTLRTRYMKWRHSTSPQAWEIILDGTEVMVPGRGYIVRAPQTYNIEGVGASQIYPAAFIGVPNNGIITHPVSGSTVVNTWNLIGNPYPSAMDATTFLNANAQTLGGTLYFWTHNTAFSSVSNFSYSTSDYATWNGTGGVATAAVGDVNDNISVPTGRIAAGQSFFVRGIGEGAGTINFDNTMRVAGSNNQFFRPTPTQPADDWQITGKHRIWLNLRGETQGFNQTLVGYIPSATNGLDHLYDGDSFGGNQVTFYSILGAKNLVIQGRALPFSNQDEVPLGYKTTLVGTLNISIDHHDGLFEGQNIYIKDNLLNIVHNLKEAPYLFTTVAGTFNDRFVLRYLPEASLGTNTPIIDANSILVFNKSNQISIKSTSHTISKVEIYDLQGRLLFSQNKVYKQEFTTQELHVNKQVVVVKITTDLDGIWIKKVVLN